MTEKISIAIAMRNFENPRPLELREAWQGMPLSYSIGKRVRMKGWLSMRLVDIVY